MRSSVPSGRPAAVLTAMLFAILASPAPAARSAAIRLPGELGNAETIELAGFGGLNRGSYRGGEFHGTFTRIESRWDVLNSHFAVSRGKSAFTVETADAQRPLSAECRAEDAVAAATAIAVDLQKLTYACDFTGTALAGDWYVALGEPKRKGLRDKLLAREQRRGEARIGDVVLTFESVHEFDGSRLASQVPLGYLISLDGVPAAAVDLLDVDPVVHLRPDLDGAARRSAVVVALALAVLRDPAHSMLGE